MTSNLSAYWEEISRAMTMIWRTADPVESARLVAEIQTSPSVVGAVKRPVLSIVPLEAAQLTAESLDPVTVAVNWIWPLASTADAVDEIVTDTVGRVGPPASGWSPG